METMMRKEHAHLSESQRVYQAFSFTKSMMVKGEPFGLAITKASRYYDVNREDVQKVFNKRSNASRKANGSAKGYSFSWFVVSIHITDGQLRDEGHDFFVKKAKSRESLAKTIRDKCARFNYEHARDSDSASHCAHYKISESFNTKEEADEFRQKIRQETIGFICLKNIFY